MKKTLTILLLFISSLTFGQGLLFVDGGFVLDESGNFLNYKISTDLLLTSNGDGVARAGFTVSEDITIALGANAKFYSDASGTLDESSTWNVIAGANRTMYVKCTTGTATFTFSDGRKVTNWAIGSGNGWVSLTTAPSISGDISGLTSLTSLYVIGLNTLSGNINPIVNGITALTLNPCAMDTYTAGATWSNATVKINPSVGYGYDSTEIDNILIDMAASNIFSGKTITLQGSSLARTSASDAAVLKLETLNSGYVHAVNTIVTNP